VRAAAVRHAFAGIDMDGSPAVHHTRGNRDCHIILRGGRNAPNYGPGGFAEAMALLRTAGLPERGMIDFSHDNSGKDPFRQPAIGEDVGRQIASGNHAIVGVMIESFLVGGRQELGAGELVYGQSITDACLDWDSTVAVLDRLAEAVRARRDAQ
jgi:3-deoxy-7-phosphoheptulonate synthase